MSYVFTFLLGKGKDELKQLLAEVEHKLEKDPENIELIEEKKEIERLLSED